MDKFTRKISFEQWFSPISSTQMEKLVETHQLNTYTKKLHIASFLRLLLFAQLIETESLRAISDTLLSDDLKSNVFRVHQLFAARSSIKSSAI